MNPEESFGPLFDRAAGLDAGEHLKDEGIANVEESHREWMDIAHGEFPIWVAGREGPFITADFRIYALATGVLPPPEKPNAWGALTVWAVKEGYIRWTGRMVKCPVPASHGAVVFEWTKTGDEKNGDGPAAAAVPATPGPVPVAPAAAMVCQH